MADDLKELDIIAQQIPTFGNRGPGIFGIKFVDTNADGIRQSTETGVIGGVPFVLEPESATANGIFDNNGFEARTTTDANGAFQFINLAPGVYRLTETVPPGAFVTTGDKTGILKVVVGNTDVNVLFGNSTTPGGGIVGCKYLDLDGDGFRDGNEPGIKNVRIYLDGTNSNPADGQFQPGELNTLTNKDGEWSIPVVAGTYKVREERVSTEPLQVDFPQSTPPNNIPLLDVTVKEGQTFYCAQVGNAPYYVIPVNKFRDIDGNGKRNDIPASNPVNGFSGPEPGIADVPFILDLNKNGKYEANEPILITGAAGTGAFRNVLPGNYSVLEIFPNTLPAVVGPGTNKGIPGNLNFPIGSTPNPLQVSAPGKGSLFQGSISEDGPLITTDAPVLSTDRTAYNPNDGGSSERDAGNLYDPDVLPGQRPIFVKDVFTPLTNAEPSVTYSPITANPGRTGGIGVGNTRPNINVFKYLDLDGDGVYEPIFDIVKDVAPLGVFNPNLGETLALNRKGERPLPGIKVSIDLDGDGDFQDVVEGQPESKQTDANGNATFTNVVPKDYLVVEELSDPKYIPSTPTVVPVNLRPERAEDANVRFGNTFKSKITGCKFEDFNQNGYRDGNEPGIAGVTIAIDVNNNGVLDGTDAITVSDQFGNWNFNELLPGTYRVREVTPQGAFKTTQPLDIVLGANQTFSCALIGNSSRYTLTVPKFRDDNRDGIQNNGEPNLLGIPFALDLNRDGKYQVGEPFARSGDAGVPGAVVPGAVFKDLQPGSYSVLEVFGDPAVTNPFPIPTGPNPVEFTVPGPSAVLQGVNPTPVTPDGTAPLSSATDDLLTGGTTPVSSATDDLLTNGGSLATQPTSGVDSLLASNTGTFVDTTKTEDTFSSLSIVPQDPLTDDKKLLLTAPASTQMF